MHPICRLSISANAAASKSPGYWYGTHGPEFRPQSFGGKRETDRRNSMGRTVADSSRGDKAPVEIFWDGVVTSLGSLTEQIEPHVRI
jgi:hypothetical protein